MKILGIDPGTTRIGYGIVLSEKGNFSAGSFGCINLEKEAPEDRFVLFGEKLEKILMTERPDFVVLEEVFFSKNKKTALQVSEMRGIIKYIARKAELPVREYTPNEVKQAVSTHGTASKKEVQKMVIMLLGLVEVPGPDDVADALAVALCGAARAWHEH